MSFKNSSYLLQKTQQPVFPKFTFKEILLWFLSYIIVNLIYVLIVDILLVCLHSYCPRQDILLSQINLWFQCMTKNILGLRAVTQVILHNSHAKFPGKTAFTRRTNTIFSRRQNVLILAKVTSYLQISINVVIMCCKK